MGWTREVEVDGVQVQIEDRRSMGGTDWGGYDVKSSAGVVQFHRAPGPAYASNQACGTCGAYTCDYLYTTDKATNEQVRLIEINMVRHALWHQRQEHS